MGDTKPRSELTAEEAFGTLNYFEIQDIKHHWNISMSQLEELAVEAMFALVWVLERRADGTVPLDSIKKMSFKEIGEYFSEEDPAGDLGEEGKDEQPVT